MSMVAERVPITVAELVAAVRNQQVTITDQAARPKPSTLSASTVVVVAAHAGAGATVVAVAIADAVSHTTGAGGPTHLVDLARPDLSGMTSAAECEIRSPYVGWRVGRRGAVTILRPALPQSSPTSDPLLPEFEGGLLVLDPGRAWAELITGAHPFWELARQQQVVVVCRATVPGVRRAELALAGLDGEPILAAVGARRWPRTVEASFGPRLAAVVDAGRAALIPADRSVEINGVGPEPLPKAVAAAAARLASLIWATEPTREQHRVKGLQP